MERLRPQTLHVAELGVPLRFLRCGLQEGCVGACAHPRADLARGPCVFASPLQPHTLHPGLGEAFWPGLLAITPAERGSAPNGETGVAEGQAVRVRPQSLGFLIHMCHSSGARHFIFN